MTTQQVTALVEKLVDQFIPQQDAKRPHLLQYLIRILSSRLQSAKSLDDFSTIEILKKKVASNKDHEVGQVTRLENLCRKLVAKKQSTVAVLHVLSQLSRGQSKDFIPFHAVPLEAPRSAQATKLVEETPQQTNEITSRSVSSNVDLMEKQLLRDLLYVFQGIDGHFIKFDAASSQFTLNAKAPVNRSQRVLIQRLSELGWLVKKLQTYVNTPGKGGLIEQNFKEGVSTELRQYYRLLAVLETQLTTSESSLTLRRLMVWCHEPLHRMTWLTALVDLVDSRPHAVLTVLSQYSHHGSANQTALTQALHSKAVTPLIQMIWHWISYGQLKDPHDEFFIADTRTNSKEKANLSLAGMWTEYFRLKSEMVPLFIHARLAEQILLIGKSINLMRQCSKDTKWLKEVTDMIEKELSSASQDRDHEAPILADQDIVNAAPQSKNNISEVGADLENVIKRVNRISNRHVMELLNSNQILEHCRHVKKYVLLQQGDFARVLVELLDKDLTQPARQVYRHNLLAILESAVRATTVQNDHALFRDRIDVLIGQATAPEHTGWDIVSLKYNVLPSELLNVVLTPQAMTQYEQLSRGILQLHRAIFHVTNLDNTVAALTRRKDKLKLIPEVATLLHRCDLLHREIHQWLHHVHYHVMIEVFETAWHSFKNHVTDCHDIDQWRSAHTSYLNEIIAGALCCHVNTMQASSQDKSLQQITNTLITTAIQWTRLLGPLHLRALETLNRRSHARQMRRLQGLATTPRGSTSEGGSNDIDSALDVQFNEEIADFTRQVIDTETTWRDHMIKFINQLAHQQSTRPLQQRVDFNGWYQQRGAASVSSPFRVSIPASILNKNTNNM